MMRIVLITSSARCTWTSFLSSSIGSSDAGRSLTAAVVSFGISTIMSGVMPLPWIDRPLGVKYFAVVSRRPEPSESGMIVCTDPFPNVWVPTTIARPQSCSAPATISDADAPPRVHHELAVVDEFLGDLHGGRQEPPRIVAQVEQERLHARLRGLLERRAQIPGRLLLELPELDVGDAATEV